MLEEIDERAAEELLRGESCADCLAAYDCAAFLFDNSKVSTLSAKLGGRDTAEQVLQASMDFAIVRCSCPNRNVCCGFQVVHSVPNAEQGHLVIVISGHWDLTGGFCRA